MEDWRRSPDLVNYAQNLFKEPQFSTLLDVLRNETPANYGLPTIGVSSDDRLAHALKTEGYNLCLNNLAALASLRTGSKHLEATFEPEL